MQYPVVLAVLGLVTMGCGLETPLAPAEWKVVDPSERAIALWTETHGAPSELCAERARAAVVEVLNDSDLARACNTSVGLANACLHRYDETGSYIAMSSLRRGQGAFSTSTHEFLHVLLACERNDWPGEPGGWGDEWHEDLVWGHMDQGSTRPH